MMHREDSVGKLRENVVSAFGGDGVAVTEVLLQAQKVGLVDRICSRPPSGMCQVTGLYVNPETGKIIVEYDDEPV